MRVSAIIGLMVAAIAFPGQAAAQTGVEPSFPAEEARRLRATALESLHLEACGSRPCAPATQEEINDPAVSDDQALLVLTRALWSAAAEVCGGDWRGRNLDPMLDHFRLEGASVRTLSLIALMHDLARIKVQATFRTVDGPCPADARTYLESALDFDAVDGMGRSRP